MMPSILPAGLTPVFLAGNQPVKPKTQEAESTPLAKPQQAVSDAKRIQIETHIGLDVFENKGSAVKTMTVHQSPVGEKSTTLNLEATDGNTYVFDRDNSHGYAPFEAVNTVRKADQLPPYYRMVHPTLQLDNPMFRPPSVAETLNVAGLPDPVTIHYTEGFDGMPQLEIPFGSQANNLAIEGFSLDDGIIMQGNPIHSASKTTPTDADYWKTSLVHGVRPNSPLVSGEKLPLQQLETTVKQWVTDVYPHELLAFGKTLPRVEEMTKLGVEETLLPFKKSSEETDLDELVALMKGLITSPVHQSV
ncbi:MAG: hypothetical protein H2174_08975 [Vampirovibrio sp.]|nr:hypothetical protein [Vampirovibrio sp.]